ncbi:MAG: hypothetical protein IKE70_00620 [Bacilli bacterium]|nr:hypothetical protein [Bacilli bacterium]
MPSSSIHLKIGYLFGEKHHLSSYLYYLGLIAPDSPNLYGIGKKKERWMAHVRRKDLREWRESLKEFYYNNKNIYPRDFLIGYVIHILTDIIYDDFFYLKVRDKIICDGVSLEDSHHTMRSDMDKYSFLEIEEIIHVLKSDSITYPILGIEDIKMLSWKNKVIHLLATKNTSLYITDSLIMELFHQVDLESFVL